MIRVNQEYDLEDSMHKLNSDQIYRLLNSLGEEYGGIRHRIIGKVILLAGLNSKREMKKRELPYQTSSIKALRTDAEIISSIFEWAIELSEKDGPEAVCGGLERKVEEHRQNIGDIKVISGTRLYDLSAHILKEKYKRELLERIGRRAEEGLLDYRNSDHYHSTMREINKLNTNGSSNSDLRKDKLRGNMFVNEENIIRWAMIYELRRGG